MTNPTTRTAATTENRINDARWENPAAKAPAFEIKNYRSRRGMEGHGFECTIYVNGKPACRATDDGNGGPTFIDWSLSGPTMHKSPLLDEVTAYCERVGSLLLFGTEHPATAEGLVENLVVEFERKRDCAKKVIFEPADGQVRSVSGAFTTAIKARIVKEFGADTFIYNEKYGQTAIEQSAEERDRIANEPLVRKGHVVFKADGTQGQWRYLKAKMALTQSVRDQLAKKYPGVVFLNDEVAARSASKTRAA